MKFTTRPALVGDAAFLTDMLVAAAFWRPDGPGGSREAVMGAPELARYVKGWPRLGDQGVIAEVDRPIGAAWFRFFSASDPGYGFVDTATPEVSMGVAPACRGQGVGRRMIEDLIAAARESRIPALSLSVELDNYAYRLYTDVGFRPIAQASGSVTMRLKL